MPSFDQVLVAGWTLESEGTDAKAGERWKRYRSRLVPSLVKLAWTDKSGAPLSPQYLFHGRVYGSVAAAVTASNREPE